MSYVFVIKNGLIDPFDIEKSISKNTLLVTVMLANNETGILQPLDEIVKIAKKYKVLLHTDAVQAVGRVDVDFNNVGCDFLTLSSHKIGGPKGAGALVVKNKNCLKASLLGGSQEYNLRAGTEALLAIAGFGVAANSNSLDQMKGLVKMNVKAVLNVEVWK